MAFKTIMI